MEDKKYCKFRGHCHYTEEYRCVTHSIFNLKYSVPKKLFIVFDSGSNYDFHFVIKELAEELKKKTTYLFRRKYRNIHYFYSSNRKRNLSKVDKN